MKDNKKCAAVVLAAGSGKRMGGDVPKQYLSVHGRPLLYYSLKTFQESFVDEIIVVTRSEDITYVRESIVKKYDFGKVTQVIAGGKERYNSVALGLEALDGNLAPDIVFIHDGARPFVTSDILERSFEAVCRYHATVAGVPSKDTVKIVDGDGFVKQTPDRSSVYIMQTPQSFDFSEIRECYRKLIDEETRGVLLKTGVIVTDDAMVMERYGDRSVYICEGDYRNIKVTTPEDMAIADVITSDIFDDEL